MLVVLRDGKKIIGVLRSFDQYGTYPPNVFRGRLLIDVISKFGAARCN